MSDAGRIVVVFGVVLVLVGGAMMLLGRFHLPGDLTIRSGGMTIYVPIVTSLIVSVILTVVLNLLLRQR